MGIKKNLWIGLKRRLQGMALGITGRPISIVDIPAEEGELGYTSRGSVIHLAPEHPLMDSFNESQAVMFVEGVFAHELMHQIATDFPNFERHIRKISVFERQIFSTIFNVMEDPAIEYLAPCYIGGHLLRSLSFTVMQCYKQSDEIPDAEPFTQLLSALIQYGDGGLLKGTFKSEEAKEYFYKVIPVFDKAIQEMDGKRRLHYAKEVFDITRPLWKHAAEEAEEMDKLMKELKRIMEENGKGSSGSGDGPMGDLERDTDAAGSSSEKKRERRKITVHKITKEEAEKMGLNDSGASSGGELPDGDIDVYVIEGEETKDGSGSESGPSIPESKSESGDEKDGAEPASENDEGSDAESKKSNEDGEGNSTNKKPSPFESSDSSKSNSKPTSELDMDMRHGGDPADTSVPEDDGVISSEEYEISEADANEIKATIESCLREAKAEEMAGKECESEPLDLPEINVQYKKASCKNIRVKAGVAPTLTKEYGRLRDNMAAGITSLTSQLKRIFKNEADEREYRCSGRANVKRMSSGRLTTRVFDRRKAPTNKSDIAVMLLIDESGSMGGQRALCARNTAIGLAEVFGNLHIPISVIGFTADMDGASALHFHYLHWLNNPAERLKLLNIGARCNNFDGYSIRYATKLLCKRPETHKLLIVVSDGQPACRYYRSGLSGIKDTSDAIKEATKKADVIGVAIGNSDTEILYAMYKNNFLHVSKVEDMYSQIAKKIQSRVKGWN